MKRTCYHSPRTPDRLKTAGGVFTACRRPPAVVVFLLFMALFFQAIFTTVPATAASIPVVNQAQLSHDGSSTATASTTVLRIVPTASQVEIYKYAPGTSGSTPVTVSAASYSPDGGNSFQPLGSIYPAGSNQPIDFSQPVPLMASDQFHQGGPIFIGIQDADHNMYPGQVESVWALVNVPATGDQEMILMQETGPDTGLFMGYIQSSGQVPPAPHDGLLEVVENCRIEAVYSDSFMPGDSSSDSALIDPLGLVFDSATGNPVSGAAVTLVDAITGRPAQVLGDDGISSFPATVISGSTAVDSSGKVYSFDPGRFRFPFVVPGNYRLDIQPPAGYRAPSQVPTAELQALPGGPFFIAEPGSRQEPFVINPGPSVRIDIPVDPAADRLWLKKSVNVDTAAVGDFVQYSLEVENPSDQTAYSTVITDHLPRGFAYRKGSLHRNGKAVSDPAISPDGRTLAINVGDLAPDETARFSYVVMLGAGALPGTAVNTAVATSAGSTPSNPARAEILVTEDLHRSRTIIAGKVMADACGQEDNRDQGVAGVRIFLEDGTFTVTDDQGRFHFENLAPGNHVVQLDLDTLGKRYEPVLCDDDSRQAGTAFSRFVDIAGGTLWRVDFHVKSKPPPTGKADLEMTCNLADGIIRYQAVVKAQDQPLGKPQLTIFLPPHCVYVAGSSSLEGRLIPDPVVKNRSLKYNMQDLAPGQSRTVRFGIKIDPGRLRKKLHTKAELTWQGVGGKQVSTPRIDTILALDWREETVVRQPVVLHPHFETFSARLSDQDRQALDNLAKSLSGLRITRVKVVGHTDNRPIKPENRHLFADNYALSLARAKSVANYLARRLRLDPSRIVVEGRGATQPVADNRIPAGRAANRRVEVTIESVEVHLVQDIRSIKCQDRVEATTIAPWPQDIEFNRLGVPEHLKPALPAAPAGQGPQPVDGILEPADGSRLATAVSAVRIQLDSRLKPRLLLDGKPVDPERIGFRMQDPATRRTLYTYIGIDFGAPGLHTLVLEGLGPFGNRRFTAEARVTRTGNVASIQQAAFDGNIADGRKPVRIKLVLKDEAGLPIKAPVELEVVSGNLKPLATRSTSVSRTPEQGRLHVDADGTAWFAPVTQAGRYTARLKYNQTETVVATYVKPELRDWILVGLAQGTAGYNTISGNKENLGPEDEKDFYTNGRLAFYAKGKIKGKWLLTARYDSERDKDDPHNRMFGEIDPDAYYTLYGDASSQQDDAASIEKLYLKIERDQFYALFGDYDTDLTVTELSRYSRRFNGFKSEYHGKRLAVTAFASRSDQAFVKDELRGDGTTGLYRLSRRQIKINSEKVTIETRDRFRSQDILESRQLTRHVDYTIDYNAGTIYFKEPIYSRNQDFNPVYIVVEYESSQVDARAYNYGGRAAVKINHGKIQLGTTFVHEGPENAEGDMAGLDASLELARGIRLKAEVAGSRKKENGVSTSGQAALAEIETTKKSFDAKVYFRHLGKGFGLGQQNGSEEATRKFGADAVYRFSQDLSASARLWRQEVLDSGAIRDHAETELILKKEFYRLSTGLSFTHDQAENGDSDSSLLATFGADRKLMNKRLTLKLDHEQALFGYDGSSDFPTRTIIGADFKLTRTTSLFADQELTWGTDKNTQTTRAGLKATPWEGSHLGTSVNRSLDENGDRVFASLGLDQTWRITANWTLEAGLERSQTLRDNHGPAFDPDVPPASGSSEDFTATNLGAGYQAEDWSWAGRIETRQGDDQDKFNLTTGIGGQVLPGLGLSAGLKYRRESISAGTRTNSGDMRLSAAFRPGNARWIVLERLDYIVESNKDPTSGTQKSRKLVNNLNTNWRPHEKLQLAFQYGAKYVLATFDDADYQGFTDLMGLEVRYDIGRRWDLGCQASMLHAWSAGQYDYGSGLSVGYSPAKNIWLSLGYNFSGYRDDDFSGADYTAQGPYLKFRFKLDQQSVRELVNWFVHD